MKEEIISTSNLSYIYGNGVQALDCIDLSICTGEMVAVIGENGAGKTTLTKHFNGLLKPTSGIVKVNGRDTRESEVCELAGTVGYVFQNPDHQIFASTVFEEIAFGPRNLGLEDRVVGERVQTAAERVALEPCLQRYPFDLSKGQRQRLAVASVLAMQPDVIILDEPTTGQDHREAMEIMQLLLELNRQGHTIIFITHDMCLVAEYARRAIVLCGGQVLADGDVRTVFRDSDVLRRTHLQPPQITQLAGALADLRISPGILSVTEFVDELRYLMEEGYSYVRYG